LFWLFTVASAWAAPAAPTEVRATPGNASVGLVWSAPGPDIFQYVICANGIEIGRSTTPGYLAHGLLNGAAYSLTIAAIDANGLGSASAPVGVTPAVFPLVPGSVTAAYANTYTAAVNVYWTPVVAQTFPVAGYAIFRSNSAASQNFYAYITAPAAVYVDPAASTVNSFSAYWYSVAAVDQMNNQGPPSTAAALSTLGSGGLSSPQGLTATAGDGTLNLSWTANATLTGYTIYYTQTPGASESFFAVSNTVSAVQIFVPNDGTPWTCAVAGNSNGAYGGRALITQRALAPPPTGLTAYTTSSYTQLTWSPVPASSGATQYIIYGDNFPSPIDVCGTTPVSVTNFVDTASWLYYAIRASNSSGPGLASADVTTPTASVLPAMPTGLRVTLGQTRALTLEWDPNPVADAALTYRLRSPDAPFGSLDLPAAVTATVINGLTNGQTYHFYLSVSNAAGGFSAETPVVTSAPAPAPLPSSFTAQVQATCILLTWVEGDTPAARAVYQVFRTNVPQPVFLTATTLTAYADQQPQAGEYSYSLLTLNALGQALPDSFVLTVTATVSIPPAPPLIVKLVPGDRQMQINWRLVDTATAYNIYRSSTSLSYQQPLLKDLPGKQAEMVDNTNLVNTLRYYYTLTAVNDAGESTRSAEYTAIPYAPARLPSDPTVRFSNLRRVIRLEWYASLPGDYPIIGYDVYRSGDGGGTFQLQGTRPTVPMPSPMSNSITVFEYVDTDVQYGQTYFYRLHALD
jgi:hypothetical protein